MTPSKLPPHTKSLLEAAGGAVAYKEGVVLRSLYPQSFPRAINVEPGDVAIIEKVEAYETMRPPSKRLHITYDLLLLRTGEVAHGVPAYQIAIHWEVVDA